MRKRSGSRIHCHNSFSLKSGTGRVLGNVCDSICSRDGLSDECFGRDAAELTALADHLTACGPVLEMLAGPLQGMYGSSGPGLLLFGFFAAMAEAERDTIRGATLEGLDTAAREGNHGGRPPVVSDDILHTVLRRRANGETVEVIQPDLLIPTGRRKGQRGGRRDRARRLRRPSATRPRPQVVTECYMPPGSSCTRTGPGPPPRPGTRARPTGGTAPGPGRPDTCGGPRTGLIAPRAAGRSAVPCPPIPSGRIGLDRGGVPATVGREDHGDGEEG